ncbi:BatA domain-containing protein [soil metagenome]
MASVLSLLFPLYLAAGAAALAVPVYLHLRRKPPRDRVEFGSLMFLQASRAPRTRRGGRPEDVLLLLLRCLALAFLAAAFARPFLGTPEDAAGLAGERIVVVDTSASMRRDGVWDEAEARARALLAGHEAAVFGADKTLREVGSVDELAPGWRASDLGATLVAAATRLAAEGGGTIHLVSDFQSGADLAGLEGFGWPESVAVEIVRVGADAETANAAVSWLAPGREAVRRARVENGAPDAREIAVGGAAILVPAGEARVLEVPGEERELAVTGDGVDFDNTLYWAPPRAVTVPVAYLGNPEDAEEGGTRFFLARALATDGRRTFEIGDMTDGTAAVVVVARALEAGEAAAVKAAVEAGAVALILEPGEFGRMVGQDVGSGESIEPPGGYAMWETVDFGHPMMGAFGAPEVRDFSKIRFWRYSQVDLGDGGATAIARFEGGDPALVEAAVGEGRAVLFAGGWASGESQLALSTKFVPLVFSILEAGGALGDDGGALLGVSDDHPEPGVFGEVAVNLDPAESRLTPMADGTLEELGVRLVDGRASDSAAAVPGEAEADLREAEAQQKLWRWAIAAVLTLLIGETAVAGMKRRPEGVLSAT